MSVHETIILRVSERRSLPADEERDCGRVQHTPEQEAGREGEAEPANRHERGPYAHRDLKSHRIHLPRSGEAQVRKGCGRRAIQPIPTVNKPQSRSLVLAHQGRSTQYRRIVTLSKSQVDRLGNRLRQGAPTEEDLRLLDDYRSTFDAPFRFVVSTIRTRLRRQPSLRPRKTVEAIAAKLERETIRLSQMQDIAGCRLVVATIRAQDETVDILRGLFSRSSVIDRRERPSHGYRAVHVIVQVNGKAIEIQVRSKLEDSVGADVRGQVRQG